MSSSTQSLLSQFGMNVAPGTSGTVPPAATSAQTQTDEILRPIEVQPNVFFDESKPAPTATEGPLFGMPFLPDVPTKFGGVPKDERYSTGEEIEAEYGERPDPNVDARIKRVAPEVEKVGGKFNPYSTEVSDILDGRGAGAYGFTENSNEILNLYEGIHGKGKVKVFHDKNNRWFEPSHYVSLERDDGTFTPYSSPIQSTYDSLKLIGSVGGYEAGMSSVAAGTAWATAGTATALVSGGIALSTLPISAPIAAAAGGLVFLYTAFNMGAFGENFKQEVLKENLGLEGEDADKVEGYIAELARTAELANNKLTPEFAGGQAYGDYTSKEKFAGAVEAVAPLPFALADKLSLTVARQGKKFIDAQTGAADDSIYPSAIPARDFAESTKGETADLANVVADVDGNPIVLEGLTLKQVKNNTVLNRLDGLVQQLSIIIPTKLRKQGESAVAYLKGYADNIGKGDFSKFRDDLDALENLHIKNRNVSPEYKKLGTSLIEVDKLFRSLRFEEAKGLYSNVFDTLGKAKYDLSTITNKIKGSTRPVVPKSDSGTIEGTQLGYGLGEANVYNAIDFIKNLGKGEQLTYQGMDTAIANFNKNNPGYEISRQSDDYVIDSPAKLLHMFATRFGEMGADIARLPDGKMTTGAKQARTAAFNMRDTLLDLIGDPVGVDEAVKKSIQTQLKDANAFYKETSDTIANARTRSKSKLEPYDTEPGQFARDILDNKAGSIENQLEAIAKQEQYVLERLGQVDYTNPAAMQELRKNFDVLINVNMARTMPTGAAEATSPTSLVEFFSKYSDDELLTLGVDATRKQELIDEANQLAKLASNDFPQIVGKGTPASSPFSSRIAAAFDSADPNAGMAKLIDVVNAETAGAGGTENLRRALFDYIVSPQSGVVKEITKNTPFERIGSPTAPNYKIDSEAFSKILEKIETTMPELKRVFTPDDIAVLNQLKIYVQTVARAGADAGNALSGAQIVGEFFTVDPLKLGRGLARLSANNKVSSLLTNPKFVDIALGKGDTSNMGAKTLRTYFFGKTAFGNFVANFALTEGEESTADQTNRMLSGGNTSGLYDQFNIKVAP